MRVLFDNRTPRDVAAALFEHVVIEARTHGWDILRNGELLDAAESAGYQVFITTDRNLEYQSNWPPNRVGRWSLIRNKLADISAAVSAATPGSFVEIEIPTNLPGDRVTVRRSPHRSTLRD